MMLIKPDDMKAIDSVVYELNSLPGKEKGKAILCVKNNQLCLTHKKDLSLGETIQHFFGCGGFSLRAVRNHIMSDERLLGLVVSIDRKITTYNENHMFGKMRYISFNEEGRAVLHKDDTVMYSYRGAEKPLVKKAWDYMKQSDPAMQSLGISIIKSVLRLVSPGWLPLNVSREQEVKNLFEDFKEQQEYLSIVQKSCDALTRAVFEIYVKDVVDSLSEEVTGPEIGRMGVQLEAVCSLYERLRSQGSSEEQKEVEALFDEVRKTNGLKHLYDIYEETKVEPKKEDVKAETKTVLKGEALSKALQQLDGAHTSLCSAMKEITKDWQKYREKIPDIIISSDESGKYNNAQKKVDELERYLLDKYEDHLGGLNAQWHGRLSMHRILWQDDKFLDAMADPLVVKAMLINAKNSKEANLAGSQKMLGEIFISSCMLFGVSGNQLSYLASAAPNWPLLPKEGEWKDFDSLSGINQLRREDISREVTSEYLDKLNKGLNTLNQVLQDAGKSFPADPALPIYEAMEKASIEDLTHAFVQLINDDNKADKLINTGNATAVQLMAAQCLETMSGYPSLLAHHQGDHSKLLGYGIISHGLDARHLAAILYVLNNPNSLYTRRLKHDPALTATEKGREVFVNLPDEFKSALEAFGKWLKEAEEGKLGPEATALVKIRMQQVLRAVIDFKDKVGVDLNTISSAIPNS